MKSKIYLIGLCLILFSIMISQKTFAKYTLNAGLGMQVYIDKTPPVITLENEGKSESYPKTDLDNIIQRSTETKTTTSDNVAVKENRYYYNPTEPNFDGVEEKQFEYGTTFTEDGYYKIESEDTSVNVTEIIVLIDKTPPEVNVQYYKKGEEPKATSKTEVVKVAATKNYMNTEQVVKVDEVEEVKEIKKVEEVEEKTSKSNNNKIAPIAAITVYNESDLRNAINNKYSQIITYGSIDLTSQLYINYNVTISPATNSNAIRYNGYGSFITIQSGGTLTLSSMVVDTNGSSGRGINAINVQSGGKIIFRETSIIDVGTNNIGILLNDGASAELNSSYIVGGAKGIIVKNNANLTFTSPNNWRNNEIANASTGISFENFTGTCNFNQSNIKIHNNSNGIIKESGSGTIKISNGDIYSNSSNGIFSKIGTLEISGGTIYSNANGINFGDGSLNISGGTIRNNNIGINLNSAYTGKMTITNVNIDSNNQYAIYHGKNEDGSCTILGGTISGKIYLAQKDNYVNTTDKYPTFEVTPSEYYFRRKLVKTVSNEVANTEIENVTMTPNGDWYKFVDKDEYIVIWRGCKVKVKYKDYFGNELSSETLTGEVGEDYHAIPKDIPGYDLIEEPSNSDGQYTEDDIVVEFKYDLKNVAIVNYEDLLSGVKSAKYWFSETENGFSGEGVDFENHKVFEDYGFYKIEVFNNVGLKRKITFSLNKDSLTR